MFFSINVIHSFVRKFGRAHQYIITFAASELPPLQ